MAVVVVQIVIPPGDLMFFRLPKHRVNRHEWPGIFHVTWKSDQVYGNIALLDLTNNVQVSVCRRDCSRRREMTVADCDLSTRM